MPSKPQPTQNPLPSTTFPAKIGLDRPGNFPLAFLAYKMHQLMQSGDLDALNYGIATVNINRPDRFFQLNPQNGLFTVAEQDPEGQNKMTVIGSVVKALNAQSNPSSVIGQIASRDTRIISLTITPQIHQSYMDAHGNLNLEHLDIVHDLSGGVVPKTLFGFIARGLRMRRDAKLPGLTIMNLDNMEHNGEVFGKLLSDFVSAFDQTPEKSIVEALRMCKFPNSMVDRIVPGTTTELLKQVSNKTGYFDIAAIPAEPMPHIASWVLEDKFANGRPNWEALGLARIVPNVLPYEQMKLRTLNVSHSFMSCLGDLAGMPYIYETMNDLLFVGGTLTLMNNETGPTLPEVPGINLPAYRTEVVSRFANLKILDTTVRVAKDAPLQVVLDSALDQIAAGRSYELLALNVAAWMRRYRVKTNELGGEIKLDDGKGNYHPMVDILKAKAEEGGNDPSAMFSIKEVFAEIGQQTEFVTAVRTYMEMLEAKGVRATIDCALQNSQDAVARATPPTTVLSGGTPDTNLEPRG